MAARFRNVPAPGTAALAPMQALAHASTLLSEHGFREVARNGRGDSLYLAKGDDPGPLPGLLPGRPPGLLRLSNHARTPKQRRGHPEVLASLVVRRPRTRAQVAAMVEAALRDFAGGQRRRDQAATGSDRSGASSGDPGTDPSAAASPGRP